MLKGFNSSTQNQKDRASHKATRKRRRCLTVAQGFQMISLFEEIHKETALMIVLSVCVIVLYLYYIMAALVENSASRPRPDMKCAVVEWSSAVRSAK